MTYHFDRSRHFANDGDREDHIKHLCGVKNLADIPLPTVFSLGQPCRSLVFRAVKEGLIKSTDLPKDHVFVDLLEKYSQESWTSQRGKKFAEGFVYFNSPLTPIPLEELSLKTAVCYQSGQENMPCIYAHALSLAVVGKLDQSQEIMDKYKDKIVEQMGAEAEASWKEVVTQSKSALQASHEGQGPVIF